MPVECRCRSCGVLPGVGLFLGYLILAALPVALAFGYGPHTDDGVLVNVGLMAALVGFALLTLQVALSARIGFINRPFGLDVVMNFHKGMAVFAAVLLIAHPILLDLGTEETDSATPWPVYFGIAALVILLVSAAFAFFYKVFRIDYIIWRMAHKGVVLVVILGFVHSLFIGPDLEFRGLRMYWFALFVMAVSLYLYRNALMPFLRRRFRVESVQAENYNTWTLALVPESGGLFRHNPGQFLFLKLEGRGFLSEEHPFTISSSPTRTDAITVTIKESGNYTCTIGKTQPGDHARVEAPFGRFSLADYEATSFLFIAGGVGITPVISMLRYLRDTGDNRPATLLFANRAQRDVLFRDELAAMPNVKVVHILSDPEQGWTGPRGRVTADLIREHAGDRLGDAQVFLCGPPPMMKQMVRTLRRLGVPLKRISYERFAL